MVDYKVCMETRKYEVDVLIGESNEKDLLKRIEESRLTEEEKEVMRALIDGGFYFGGQVGANDGDGGIAVITILRKHFEIGVNAIVRDKRLAGEKRRLACDLSSFGYNVGQRTYRALRRPFDPTDYDKNYPKNFQRVIGAIS